MYQYTSLSASVNTWIPAWKDSDSGGNAVGNFGQRPFVYTAPSGFKALCTTNLDDPLVAKPSTAMDVALYTGNGSTQTISGLGFSPDFAWIKCRSEGSTNPAIWDAVRGPGTSNSDTNRLSTNNTNAEETTDPYGYVSAFNSDGITVEKGSTTTVSNTNRSGQTYVAWTWDGGSSTVSNTDGSITSQVRANQSAGFSIVSYTSTGATSTVGHGLNAAPAMVITKCRSIVSAFVVQHTSLAANNVLYLNGTDATQDVSANGTLASPTSSVFSVNNQQGSNGVSGTTMIAYCFAPVEGYSAFGSYTGNGSSDGPFVYTGFRPRWILYKNSSIVSDWRIYDAVRLGYNTVDTPLYPNLSIAENTTTHPVDILSNGFKVRGSAGGMNESGNTIVFAAFAENPFKTARAR
jgi:hypothetical protein